MLKTKDVPCVYTRDSINYFTTYIPNNFQGHYRCPRIVMSRYEPNLSMPLKTATILAAQLDEEWLTISWHQKNSPLKRLLTDQSYTDRELSNAPLLLETKAIYLNSKSEERPVTFKGAGL